MHVEKKQYVLNNQLSKEEIKTNVNPNLLILFIKYITNKDLIYSTWSYTQYHIYMPVINNIS